MLFEGLSSIKGISKFRRRIIVVLDVCKTQVSPAQASAQGTCLGLSKVPSPTEAAAGLGDVCSAEEALKSSKEFQGNTALLLPVPNASRRLL